MKTREKVVWSGLHDGPWPMVDVAGDLDNASEEWLHTNGAGAYSMSTVALMHTRRHHGLLVAALDGLKRAVVVSHVEAVLEAEGKTYRLSTHQFPNVAPTPGYRMLETFAQDPLPRWVFRAGRGTLERTLALARGQNTVVLGFTWSGRSAARLLLRPLLSMRPVEELMREHGAMLQKVTLRAGEVEVQPVRGMPPVRMRHGGVFMGSPDWWRRFEYLDDRGRYEQFQEDLWCPGLVEVVLEPRETQYLMAGLGELPEARAAEVVMETAQHILAQDPGHDWEPTVRALEVASDQFVQKDGSILAGYPWLDVWSRDQLLALPGIHLVRGRLDDAERCLLACAEALRDGLLPQRLTAPAEPFEPAVDATLWFFEATRLYSASLGARAELVGERLYPALVQIFRRFAHAAGVERQLVWLTAEGFIETGGEGAPLTWMDARTETHVVTPRAGLAVEVQALWSRACDTLAALARGAGDFLIAEEAGQARDRVRETFKQRFWCNETEYPFDCVSADRDLGDAWADPTIRPNALIALAVDPELFEPWQRRSVLERVERELLTPRGIRSLAPADPHYVGYVAGTAEERLAAFHQGPAWLYLLNFYVRASLAASQNPVSLQLRKLVLEAVDAGHVLGQVPQSADGEPPHRPHGAPAQACSVGMLLELLVNYLPEPL